MAEFVTNLFAGAGVLVILGVLAAVGHTLWQKFGPPPKHTGAGISRSGSNALLAEHDIVRPELLMANMLALRIAQLPQHPEGRQYGSAKLELPLGRPGHSVGVHYYTNSSGVHVYVNKPDFSFTTLILEEEEQRILHSALEALTQRTKKLVTEANAQASSTASLDALTALLCPVDTPAGK